MNLTKIKTFPNISAFFLMILSVIILFSFPPSCINADPGDSFSTAIEIKLGYAMGHLSSSGDRIYYRVTVTYPEPDIFGYDYYETWIYLTPLTGSANFDPDIYLYYSQSAFLQSSTSSGYLVELIEWREEGFAEIGGRDHVVTYFIEIRCYAGSGDFSLNIYYDFGEWGDSPQNAYKLGYTDPMDTTFELGNTTDNLPGPSPGGEMWYVIPLNAEDYNFTLTGPENTDFNLDLYDRTLTLIGSANSTTYPDILSVWNITPSEYGIKITSLQGSGTFTLNIAKTDILPPSITIVNPVNGTFTRANVTFSYSVSDGSSTTTTIYVDNIANTTTIPSDSILTDLAEGSHNITIVAVDIAGNIGKFTVLFTVDITSPIVNIISPSNKDYGQNEIQLNYTISDGTPTIYIDDIANTTALPSGSILVDLTEGTHNVTIVAVDAAENIGTTTVMFTVDTISPLIVIDSLTSIFYSTNIIPITLSGEADHYWYWIEGADIENQTWPFTLERGLADGIYTVHAYGNDSVGNEGHTSVTITIDTTNPTIDQPNDIVYSTDNKDALPATIIWYPSDVNPASYTIFCNETLIDSDIWDGASININITEFLLATPNNYVFVCTVFDQAGNNISDSVHVSVEPPESNTKTETVSTTLETTEPSSTAGFDIFLGIIWVVPFILYKRKSSRK